MLAARRRRGQVTVVQRDGHLALSPVLTPTSSKPPLQPGGIRACEIRNEVFPVEDFVIPFTSNLADELRFEYPPSNRTEFVGLQTIRVA